MMRAAPRTRSLLSSKGPAPPDLLKERDWSVPPMIEPKIDDLLATVDSKYTLVILSAKRAREINSYYNPLGEGRGEFPPPLVEPALRNKPLSIALEEIAEGKIDYERPEEIIEVD